MQRAMAGIVSRKVRRPARHLVLEGRSVPASLWPQIIIAGSTLLAAFLGYLLAGLNEARRDRRAADRERLARAEDRQTTAIRAQHEFQLETLLALQDAIQLMARVTGRAMHFDHMQARQGLYTQLPDNYSEKIHANAVDVTRLRNRVLDEDLRAAIEQFQSTCNTAASAVERFVGLKDEALERVASGELTNFGLHVDAVMNQLGASLRTELSWLPSDLAGATNGRSRPSPS